MTKYPASRLAGLIKVKPLPEGYESATVRVRGRKEVLTWFAALTAAEPGELLMGLYNGRNSRRSNLIAPKAAPSAGGLQPNRRYSRQDGAGRVRVGPTLTTRAGPAQIVHELRHGGVLTEQEGVWTMTLPDSSTRRIGPMVMRLAFQEGVLVDQGA